jgi:hypothetical protein
VHSHHSTVENIGIEPTPFNISGKADAANTLEIYCFFEVQLRVVSRELGEEIQATIATRSPNSESVEKCD